MANEITDKVKKAIDELVTLRIVTSVGTVDASSGKPEIDYKNNPKVMLSKIDLLQGDIEISIDEVYLDEKYAQLMAIHSENTKEAREIIHSNIEALKKLVQLGRELF